MKTSIYSIYDNVAEVFNKPFTEINDGTATRSFITSVQEQPHKNDFVLYKLADMTDHDGSIKPLKVPLKILSGFEVKIENLPDSLQKQAI